MVHKQHELIFQAGSRTYYNSARFFPRHVRDEVFVLYGFVRVADNFVDALPQNPRGFYEFCRLYRQARDRQIPAGDHIIDPFVQLEQKQGFDPAWTEAFLASMEMDLTKQTYDTLEETLEYIYGSAEVIGLFMAGIMGLPEESRQSAALLGRAMQYINFIRDIDEDNRLGRRYLPLTGTSLKDLNRETAEADREAFSSFIRQETDRYRQWQQEAEKGYRFIPRRYRIPIKTAADMYRWTAETIAQDPLVVYRRKVKPAQPRILLKVLSNSLGGA